jgi:hypothetical protein
MKLVENMMVSRMFGPKRERSWRKDVHNMFSATHTKIIKSRRSEVLTVVKM